MRKIEDLSVNLQKQTRVIPEGERFAKNLWNKITNLNDDIAHRVSREIVEFAKRHGAKIIVFEYLDNLKPSKGTKSHRLNQKFIFWVKGRIFRYTRYKALHEGIVTCRVSPKNTSARCPYCGFLIIVRYNKGKDGREINGIDLAKCTNCGVHDVNSDYVGSLGMGTASGSNTACKVLSRAGWAPNLSGRPFRRRRGVHATYTVVSWIRREPAKSCTR